MKDGRTTDIRGSPLISDTASLLMARHDITQCRSGRMSMNVSEREVTYGSLDSQGACWMEGYQCGKHGGIQIGAS